VPHGGAEVDIAVLFADVIDGDDIRVLQLGDRLGFMAEAHDFGSETGARGATPSSTNSSAMR
jgi:hypothetical protein